METIGRSDQFVKNVWDAWTPTNFVAADIAVGGAAEGTSEYVLTVTTSEVDPTPFLLTASTLNS
uniref:Uncharacterized protein n=1 Tax=Romanomermis culicivorax TaxID=13658 RepID=A0A915J3P6_ROMCU